MLVVGGGTAGLVAAHTAAGFGARVLLVERARTGGDCLWTGCVPSKALVAAAGRTAALARPAHLGVRGAVLRSPGGLPAVAGHWRAAITTIEPHDSPDALRAAGAEVLTGELTFTGPASAVVDGREVRFHHALVATGARPATPDLPGLAAAGPLTSETVWDALERLDEVPRRLVVLGGGPVGCELAQALARLGSRVTVVQSGDRLLAREDPDAADRVRAALAADGVEVRTGTRAEAVDPAAGGGGTVRLSDGARVPFDRLLVALGRVPRTAELGLDRAGVDLDARGHVRVDACLRTSNPRVWAAGDVTEHPAFTHVAGVHGSLAAANAVLGLRRTTSPVVPRVTFTSPEVAAVGVPTGAPLRPGLRAVTVEHDDLDRAVTEDDRTGFTRLVLDRRSRVVGATVVGPRAGESLAEVTLAISRGLRTRDLAAVTHPYPTWGDGVWNAAVADVRRGLARPPVAGALHALVRVRRAWRSVRPPSPPGSLPSREGSV
nr:FAD-dependent oxidoreductase [Kineococcus siccus]